MSSLEKADYLIIGQGLVGSAMAIQLLLRNKRIVVVDQPEDNTSSNIAAGLFNVITGKRVVKTWMADKIFPYLHEHYRGAESLTKEKFFYPMPLYRPFGSIEDQNEWMAKSASASFQDYVDHVSAEPAYRYVKDPFGGLLLKQCGYLDTRKYIDGVRNLIRREGVYLSERASTADIQIGRDQVTFKGYTADRIIFCHGTHENRWFSWLPIRALKGETLRVQSTHSQELIINKGVYIVPGGKSGEWRIGATYNLHDHQEGPTELARAELVEKMNELVSFPFNIVGQEWGLRPTTPDRRPILGRHPEFHRAFICNGMGTKGVSLSPFLAEVLVRHIENDEPLNKEVDIERYKLLYWSSPKSI